MRERHRTKRITKIVTFIWFINTKLEIPKTCSSVTFFLIIEYQDQISFLNWFWGNKIKTYFVSPEEATFTIERSNVWPGSKYERHLTDSLRVTIFTGLCTLFERPILQESCRWMIEQKSVQIMVINKALTFTKNILWMWAYFWSSLYKRFLAGYMLPEELINIKIWFVRQTYQILWR